MENLRGIGWMVLAMASFAVEDMLLKILASSVPTGLILIFIGTFGASLFYGLCRSKGIAVLGPNARHPVLLLRNAVEVAGTALYVASLILMPLSTATAIFQASPLLVGLGAVILFKAVFGWRRWTALAVGFAGVLVIIRPGFEGFAPASLLAVLATVCMSIRDLSTRGIPKGISSFQISVFGFISLALGGVILTPFLWTPPILDTQTLGLTFLASLLAICGYFSVTAAMRVGEVAAVTPFRYTRLVFAMILGLLAFGETPDGPTLIGAAMILGSGLYTLYRERHARSRPLSSTLKAS